MNLLEVTNLQKHFPIRTGFFGKATQTVKAVDRVDLSLASGETLGLVGESGCGKTTLGRCILRLIEPTAGTISFEGEPVTGISGRELQKLRTRMQIIFQDPYSSLNPRMVVLDLIGEGLTEHRLVKNQVEKKERVVALLEQVGLSSQILYRYPHEFSGGQRQRIAIARAISLNPSLLICDEAVSALDVSIQAQIINLLMELQKKRNMTYLFISHDLAVVKHVSQRIAVMYLGQIVEMSSTGELFKSPAHPYTRALLSAIPIPDPEVSKKRIVLSGEVSQSFVKENGCCFVNRCPEAQEICKQKEPGLKQINHDHYSKCFFG